MRIFLWLEGRRSNRATEARFFAFGKVAHTGRSVDLSTPATPGNPIRERGTKSHSDELGRDIVVAQIRLPVTISTRGNSND